MAAIDVFAANLKRLREKAGISQDQLALKMNLSPSSVRGWEYKLRWPSHENIDIICKALKVDVSELFGNEPGMIIKPTLTDTELMAAIAERIGLPAIERDGFLAIFPQKPASR